MKKSRFSEEQVIGILKQHQAGMKTSDLCREQGISAATFYEWKQKFGGMDVAEALAQTHGLSERGVPARCWTWSRSGYRYEPRPGRNAELRCELVKLAREKPRYRYRRLHALLERRGHEVNVKADLWAACGGRAGGAAAQAAGAGSSAGAASDPAQP